MRYTVRSGLVIVTFLWALGPAQIIAQERSSPSTGSNPIVSTERPPKITLRVATWASAEEFELEQRMAERFMQLYPEITVEHESIPSSYREKILAAYAAGTVPDVFLLDSPIIPALMNRGLLVNLSPYEPQTGIDPDDYYEAVRAVFLNNGELLAFPKDFTPLLIYYNRALFRKANLPYPSEDWTWDDFLSAAKALTLDEDGDGKPDQFGSAFDNKLYLWQPWIWTNGGDLFAPDGTTTKGVLTSEKTLEAFQFLVDLRVKHGVTPPMVGVGNSRGGAIQGTVGMFYGGRLAMMPSGRWAYVRMRPYLQSGDLDVGVAPLPSRFKGQKSNVIYAAGWSVSKSSPHREWAVRLAAFLSSEEAQLIRAESPIGIPSLKKVAAIQASNDPFGIEQVFMEEAAFGRQSWGTKIDDFSRIEYILESALDRTLFGNEPLPVVMEKASQEIDQLIATNAAQSKDFAPLSGNSQIMGFLYWGCLLVLIGVGASIVSVRRKHRYELTTGLSFITPSFVVLFVFVLIPLVFSLYLSFHQWDIISSNKPFVGTSNFEALLSDAQFWKAISNTFIYTLHVPIGMVISLGIALLLSKNTRGMAFWRMIFFLPSVSSMVAIAMVWQWMYHPEFGLVNYGLRFFGLPPGTWLTDPKTALISLMIVNIWISIGYQMVIFLAGLKGIPSTYYDAARVDGANWWHQFVHITLPLLRPTTLFILVTSVISSFQVFTLVFIMTEGGPLDATEVVVHNIYRNAYDFLQMGYASAMAWILFLIVGAITWLQFRITRKRVTYS
ncbi:MAG: extracellular solute-binding protein [Bacteroidetes bacterium]|nr:extracellular solute-binding protein [Bacteroidota bacterium]